MFFFHGCSLLPYVGLIRFVLLSRYLIVIYFMSFWDGSITVIIDTIEKGYLGKVFLKCYNRGDKKDVLMKDMHDWKSDTMHDFIKMHLVV